MKMNKKKLAVVSLVLCIAAIISMASLAWFQSSETVENTLNFVDEFEIELYETDPEDEETGKTLTGLTFNNVRPGDVLDKDPTIVNKCSEGGENMWVRMNVTVTGTDVWSTLGITDLTSIFTVADDFDSTWKRYDAPDASVDGQLTYTFYLLEKLAPGASETLFTAVNIPEKLTIDQVAALDGSCTITVTADAIQADGAGLESITDAYTAFGNWTAAE